NGAMLSTVTCVATIECASCPDRFRGGLFLAVLDRDGEAFITPPGASSPSSRMADSRRIELVAGRIAGLQHRQASSIEASAVTVVPEANRQLRANSTLNILSGLGLLPKSNKN